MREVRIALAVVVLGAALVAVPSAGATITVGSNLTAAVNGGAGGDIVALPIAPAGALPTSPVAGTIVGGTVKQDTSIVPPWGTASLWVVRPASGGKYQAISAGPANTIPSGTGTFPVTAHLPIAKGDLVAIQTTGNMSTASAPGAAWVFHTTSTFPPGGSPQTFSAGSSAAELLYNAQIDPSNSFTVGAPTILKKGKATVVVTVPNPGAISGGSSNDTGLAATAKKKKKKTKPLLAQVTAAAADAGPVTLTFSASKAGKKLLREKGKLKTSAKIVYTPTGGSASTQTIQLKLKP